MKKIKVLILGVSAVQMDAVIELNKLGIQTYTCAREDDGPGSSASDFFEKLNFTDKARLKKYIEDNRIDFVYSVGSDLAIPIASGISEELKLPFFVSSDIAVICNNKIIMREFFGADFKGNLPFIKLKDSHGAITLNYPFIIKPSDSQGQRGISLICEYNELISNFQNARKYSRDGMVIAEKYIEGRELSVNVYVINNSIAFSSICERVVWPQFKSGIIRKHIISENKNDKVIDLVTRSIQKLGIRNGPLYFQIKLSADNEPYIIEVTPRLDGCHLWKLIKYYCGVNLMKLLFEHLLFGKTDELKNYYKPEDTYTIEYLCDKPGSLVDYSKYDIPDDALECFRYYNNGDVIKSINDKYEKLGYYIVRGRR